MSPPIYWLNMLKMNNEDKLLLESKLHCLAILELDRGLTGDEMATQEKLYQEYVQVRKEGG